MKNLSTLNYYLRLITIKFKGIITKLYCVKLLLFLALFYTEHIKSQTTPLEVSSDFQCKIDAMAVIKTPGNSASNSNFAYSGTNLSYLNGLNNIGDIDNDGIDDFAVSSWTYGADNDYFASHGGLNCNIQTVSNAPSNGMVFIFFGRKVESPNYWANTLNLEEQADMILMNNNSMWFGYSITPLGKFNNDSYDDFAIGDGGSNGSVYILYGKKNRASWNLTSPVGTPAFSRDRLPGLASSSSPPVLNYKYKFVKYSTVFGAMIINGESTIDYFGKSLGAADLDNDGFNDLIIGAPGAPNSSTLKAGKVYIVKGGNKDAFYTVSLKDQKPLHYGGGDEYTPAVETIGSPPTVTQAFVSFIGNSTNQQVGYSCSGTPSINSSDEIEDLLIGTGEGDFSETVDHKGHVFLIFGSSNFFSKGHDIEANTSSNVDVTFIGALTSGTNVGLGLGIALAGVKNFALDGSNNKTNAIALGAPGRVWVDASDGNTEKNTGMVFLFFRKTWNAHDVITLNHLGSDADASIFGFFKQTGSGGSSGDESWGRWGFNIKDIGDFNNDGFHDLAFGCDYDRTAAGATYPVKAGVTVLNGGESSTTYSDNMDTRIITASGSTHALKDKLISILGEDQIHVSAHPASNGLCFIGSGGDYNGDGVSDIFLSDYTYIKTQTLGSTYSSEQAGRAYIRFSEFTQTAWAKDDPNDDNTEINNSIHVVESPDLWVRQSSDNLNIHQNAEYYNSGLFNAIYMNVRNLSGSTLPANKYQVFFYWTFAAAGETWPRDFDSRVKFNSSVNNYYDEPKPANVSWSNSYSCIANGTPVGGCINPNNPLIISSSISAGSSIKILYDKWAGIDPAVYCQNTSTFKKVNVCLLARIVPVGINDPYKNLIGEKNNVNVVENVRGKHAIVTRNMYCVNESPLFWKPKDTTAILIRNTEETGIEYSFSIISDTLSNGETFLTYGYYTVDLGDYYSSWVTNGAHGSGIELIESSTEVKITSANAWIDGVRLEANESMVLPLIYHYSDYFDPYPIEDISKLEIGTYKNDHDDTNYMGSTILNFILVDNR